MKYCSSKLSLGLKKGDYLWIILLLTLTTQKYNLETDYEALEWKGLGKRIKCTWVCWNLFGKPQWMWVNLKPKGAEVETLNCATVLKEEAPGVHLPPGRKGIGPFGYSFASVAVPSPELRMLDDGADGALGGSTGVRYGVKRTCWCQRFVSMTPNLV